MHYSNRFRKPVLDYVYIPITLECNRNCKGCVSYSPLAGPETRVTFEQYERAINRLVEIAGTDTIQHVDIAGGEPLLHPDLLQILEFTRSVFKNNSIMVRSNGLLLPDFIDRNIEFIKKYSISVEYSQYPEVQTNRLFNLSNRHNILIKPHFHNFNFVFQKIAVSEMPNYVDMNEEWHQCSDANSCHTLRIIEDKAYYTGCSTPVYIDTLDRYFGTRFESLLKKGDRIDIFDPNTTLDDLLNFHQPLHFCAHCKREKIKFNNNEISEKSKKEWL